MSTTIVLFRQDLRLHDHPALTAASQRGAVIPVFVLDDEACGEIETAHPGCLGSQDTFYVGTLKGVGRVYQQTYIDTYSKVAQAKLCTAKTPITAADLLNDRVLPFH